MDHVGRTIADTLCIALGVFGVVLFYNYGLDLGLIDHVTGPIVACAAGAIVVQFRRMVWD